MGRLEGSVESLTREVKRANDIATARLDAHGTRISRLERWRTHSTSFLAGISFVVGAVYAAVKLL